MTQDWWTLFFRNPAPEKKEQLFPDDTSSIARKEIVHLRFFERTGGALAPAGILLIKT